MIKSIHLKNYILIDDLTIDFSSGLNVITGETGAGKSILINATDIAFGAKSGVNLIKKGADKAIIEVFLSAENNNLKDLFEENGIDLFDEIVLTREITQNSSRTRVNGTLVNQQFLKEIKELLIDIHSQHQTYTFMQPKSHIKLLDSYAKDIYGNDLEEYKNLYFQYKEILNDLENAKNAANVTESQIDFLKFQINEIEEAEIKDIHEDEDLVKELSILENAEKLKELTSSAYWALNGEDNSILEAISKIKMNISKAVNLDSSLKDIESSLIELLELTRDTSNVLRDYSQSVSDDTERLNEVQERIFILDKMKHKYGNSLENVLENYNKFSEELSQIEFSTKNIDDLQNKSELIFEQMKKLASKISEQRKNCAEILSSLIVEELEKLELSKARFEIQIEDTDYSLTGKDEVEFYIATNVSQDLAPLSKTA
jgi:DNA repair protein RecN (Recombination protein N)